MPRNDQTIRRSDLSDPLSMPPQPQAHGESVLSRYHPDNNRREHERQRAYTFRQRSAKLDLTLGWELEANHAPTRIPCGVEYVGDGSVNGEAAEMVVLPAVTKSPRYVLGLLKDLVHAPKLNTDDSCGFHVHVSASNISSLARMRQWAIATEHLAVQVEDLAFRAVPDSRKGNTYCKRIIPLASGTKFEAHKYNNSRRYHWLNIVEMFRPNGIRTIENRLLGHTHRWKYVLAWTLFTMELARRGWELSNKPFDTTAHKDVLSEMLLKIAKEIKPLDKRAEPIPQWVYNGLATFGIEANAWDRPLARLSETEAGLRGMPKVFYSDNQIEIPNRNEDDESDECPCGCGNEGRCQSQEHEDGDCENNYCEYCHENGNCDGVPDCEHCIMNAHDNGDYCQRRNCSECRPHRGITPPVPEGSTMARPVDYTMGTPVMAVPPASTHVPVNLAYDGPMVHPDTLRAAEGLLGYTMTGVQPAITAAMRDNVLYGQTGNIRVTYDEASHSPRVGYTPVEPMNMTELNGRLWNNEQEFRVNEMLDIHEQALSAERERNITRGL